MSRSPGSFLDELVAQSYRRAAQAMPYIYPATILYLSQWVPEADKPLYFGVRFLIMLVLIWISRNSLRLTIYQLRLGTVLGIGLFIYGNVKLVALGGPDLTSTITECSFLLVALLELRRLHAWMMIASFTLMWQIAQRTLDGEQNLFQAGLPVHVIFALLIVSQRAVVMRRIARLLADQREIHERQADAVALLDDYNVALDERVNQRRRELIEAHARLQKAHRELQEQQAEQSRVQASWAQGHRLELLAKFAAGLCHCFGNSLTCISGGLDELEATPHGSEVRGSLHELRTATERASLICRRLMMLSGGEHEPPRDFEVLRQLEDSLPLLRRAVPNPLELRGPGRPSWLHTDASQLDQAIWNLVLNAAQASEPTAPIEIRVGGTGDTVEISVIDRGHGINPQVEARIFEPFFTTKSTGQGFGLGLAIVNGCVERMGGTCQVLSRYADGTTFILRLPGLSQVQTETAHMTAPVPNPLPPLRLALVEDESTLRNLVQKYLCNKKHSVISAGSAEELVINPEEIDILISDVVLPGINGVRLAEQYADCASHLQFLFVSGYPLEVGSVAIENSRWRFLPKPFRLSELEEKLSELLASRAELA